MKFAPASHQLSRVLTIEGLDFKSQVLDLSNSFLFYSVLKTHEKIMQAGRFLNNCKCDLKKCGSIREKSEACATKIN